MSVRDTIKVMDSEKRFCALSGGNARYMNADAFLDVRGSHAIRGMASILFNYGQNDTNGVSAGLQPGEVRAFSEALDNYLNKAEDARENPLTDDQVVVLNARLIGAMDAIPVSGSTETVLGIVANMYLTAAWQFVVQYNDLKDANLRMAGIAKKLMAYYW